MVARIENLLDLMDESLSYSMVSTSLINPDIVLPHQLFRERHGLPEIPPGHGPEPREYVTDGARGLVDLDWSQQTPIFHPDNINHDPRFSQYPYQEEDTLMAPPTNTKRLCNCLPVTYSHEPAQIPGSPWSTHTDTDTGMEMGGLSMAPGGPDTCHIAPRASAPLVAQGSMSTLDLAATVARGVAAAATQILERFAWLPPVNEADRSPLLYFVLENV